MPSRRSVLSGAGAAALLGTAALGTAAMAGCSAGTGGGTGVGTDSGTDSGGSAERRNGTVFTLGVASGDPGPDGMVLWTRLARDPLAEDGLGGMPAGPVNVQWELATDPRFAEVLQRGEQRTDAELGYAVHVRPIGLASGREYWYRFRVGAGPTAEISPSGRTRTVPADGELGSLTLCFTSCARYEQGLYTAYRRLAEDNPDLVACLGDYVYEYGGDEIGAPVRRVAGGETRTLADYRRRYAQYHADPDLQAAHAAAPWVLVPDDHELENNWAADLPEKPDPDYPARRAAALRAYYENLPLPESCRPTGGSIQLYRRLNWGALAGIHLLDTRQYRGDQPCDDKYRSDCPERTDPARSMLGPAQEAWLLDGFRQSRSRWDLLAQQVFFSQVDLTPGAERRFNPDAWDGYVGSRDRVVDGWRSAGVRNAVVLTGDVHAHWAADVKARFDDPAAPVVGTELVTTSISSGGDGVEVRADTAAVLAENPHVRFFNSRRGYVRARITPDTLTADFRVVPFVTRPDAPVETRASFVVRDRRPGLDPA